MVTPLNAKSMAKLKESGSGREGGVQGWGKFGPKLQVQRFFQMRIRPAERMSLLAGCLFLACPPESRAQHFFPSQADYSAPILGSRAYMNVLVKFADTGQVTPHPRSFYEELLGKEPGGLDHYIREISYDKANLAGSQTVDWITLARPAAAYRGTGKPSFWNGYELMADALKRLIGHVDVSQFYGINFFVNVSDDQTASQWTFWFQVAGKTRPIPVTLINPQAANAQTVVHEMLHNWGFDHTCLTAADITTAPVSDVDPMSNLLNGLPDVNGYHKLRAGWIDASKVYDPAPNSARTLRIERLDQPRDAKGYLLAKIPIGGAFSEYYTVECRRKAGYDTVLRGEGVVIHHVDESAFNFRATPPIFERAAQCIRSSPGDNGPVFWRPGQVFSPGISGVVISVMDEDATGCTVRIEFKGPRPSLGLVTTTADGGAGSLRDALSWAQRQTNGAKIRFAIPRSDPNFRSGVYLLQVKRPLPYLFTDGVEIIAPTQRENGNLTGGVKPGVFLDGSGVPASVSGLVMRSANCVVKNLAIGNFGDFGIWVQGLLAKSNRIENCFIGTTADGKIAAPNGHCGIAIHEGATSTQVVSNLVSGNKGIGIQLLGSWFIVSKPVHGIEVSDTLIANNRVGTDYEGNKPLPNRNSGIALHDGSVRNQIGTPDGKGGNLISGNINSGVVVAGFGTKGNLIIGNRIGVNADNTGPLTNSFPPIQLLSGNTVSGNIVYPGATSAAWKQ